MPTYEYKCDKCGHEFEAFQSIKDEPIKICPVCNSKVHRVINGGVGLIFKGSGFYVTDYKNAQRSGDKRKSGTDTDNDKKPDKDSGSSMKKGDPSD